MDGRKGEEDEGKEKGKKGKEMKGRREGEVFLMCFHFGMLLPVIYS